MDAVTTELDLHAMLNEFFEEFSDELDSCHPEAFELIYEQINGDVNREKLKLMLSDFKFYHLEELEGCNDDAYLFMSNIMEKFGIEE